MMLWFAGLQDGSLRSFFRSTQVRFVLSRCILRVTQYSTLNGVVTEGILQQSYSCDGNNSNLSVMAFRRYVKNKMG